MNQYKSGTIHDCIAWAYKYLLQFQKSKLPTIMLKIDFEKAFDKLEHGLILAILRQKGFGTKWCSCV